MELKEIFASERLRFVEPSETLVKDYLAMVNDVERVARLIGTRTEPLTEEQERSWVRRKLEEKAALYSMIEKATGDFIGNCELMDVRDGYAELGIAITGDKQDRGFGTEAVRALVQYGMDTLGLRRVFLRVFPDNARAIRVYEKCAFREYDRTAEDVFMEITR